MIEQWWMYATQPFVLQLAKLIKYIDFMYGSFVLFGALQVFFLSRRTPSRQQLRTAKHPPAVNSDRADWRRSQDPRPGSGCNWPSQLPRYGGQKRPADRAELPAGRQGRGGGGAGDLPAPGLWGLPAAPAYAPGR
jgi:hypothetical protein